MSLLIAILLILIVFALSAILNKAHGIEDKSFLQEELVFLIHSVSSGFTQKREFPTGFT